MTEVDTIDEKAQEDILDSVSEKLDGAVEQEKQEKEEKKLKTKRDYIIAIKKLTNKYSDRELQRTKKEDLKQILAGSFEETVEKVAVPDPHQGLVVSTMYRLSLGLCSLVEGVSKQYGAAYFGYELHEYAQTIDENPGWKMTMISVLEDIYKENQEMLTQLCTKEGRLMFVLVMAGMQSCRKSEPRINGSRRHQSTVEQDNHNHWSAQSREEQLSPVLSSQSRRREQPRARGTSRRNSSVRERGLLSPMGLAAETTQGLPGTTGIGNPGVLPDQREEAAIQTPQKTD